MTSSAEAALGDIVASFDGVQMSYPAGRLNVEMYFNCVRLVGQVWLF